MNFLLFRQCLLRVLSREMSINYNYVWAMNLRDKTLTRFAMLHIKFKPTEDIKLTGGRTDVYWGLLPFKDISDMMVGETI